MPHAPYLMPKLEVYLHLPEHLPSGEEVRRAEDRRVGMLVEQVVTEDGEADGTPRRQRQVVADARVEHRVTGDRLRGGVREAGTDQRPVARIVVLAFPGRLDRGADAVERADVGAD